MQYIQFTSRWQVYVKIVVNIAKLAMRSMTAKFAKQALCQLKGSASTARSFNCLKPWNHRWGYLLLCHEESCAPLARLNQPNLQRTTSPGTRHLKTNADVALRRINMPRYSQFLSSWGWQLAPQKINCDQTNLSPLHSAN